MSEETVLGSSTRCVSDVSGSINCFSKLRLTSCWLLRSCYVGALLIEPLSAKQHDLKSHFANWHSWSLCCPSSYHFDAELCWLTVFSRSLLPRMTFVRLSTSISLSLGFKFSEYHKRWTCSRQGQCQGSQGFLSHDCSYRPKCQVFGNRLLGFSRLVSLRNGFGRTRWQTISS